VCAQVQSRFATRYSPIIVVAEGAIPAEGTLQLRAGGTDSFGHVRLGGIGDLLAKEIEQRTGEEARAVVLGPSSAAGPPTAFRPLARYPVRPECRSGGARQGVRHDGRAPRGRHHPGAAVGGHRRLKTVRPELYEEAEVLFG
jgi:6-phosphofructokinase 1